jgi:hypothetical protein
MRAKGARDALELTCPRCGSTHGVRISRLDRSCRCGSCGASFRITEQGRYVVEDAHWAQDLAEGFGTTGKRLRRSGAARQLQRFWTRWADVWNRLPGSWRLLALVSGSVFATLFVISWALIWWTQRIEPPVEHSESLSLRAELACHALLINDEDVLFGLTTRDTRDDARRWLGRVRPQNWPASSEFAKQTTVELRTLFKSVTNQRATVAYVIRTHRPQADNSTSRIEGVLCWTLGHDGRWQLDGRRTLHEQSTFRSTDDQ